MKFLFNPDSIFFPQGMAIIRIIFGALIIYHGQEIFDSKLMSEYTTWDTFSNSYGKLLVYMGKASELIAGILIFLGLHTRIGTILLMGTMLYITFFVGQGRFWYQDQHPFMFAMMGLVFFFYGSGIWSLDELLVRRKQKQ
jgi:putative oxidoreductase